MAETLGSLCDKLTIVKLKQWHAEDSERQNSLSRQEEQLTDEINQFVKDALTGRILPERLIFAANKIYKEPGNDVPEVSGSIGKVMAQLAQVNCNLWHEQERVYDFENVPIGQKDVVVKRLALLNLERNKCIDQIDRGFQEAISRVRK